MATLKRSGRGVNMFSGFLLFDCKISTLLQQFSYERQTRLVMKILIIFRVVSKNQHRLEPLTVGIVITHFKTEL